MKKIDSLDLDPRTIRAFLAIYDKRSLTEASEQLGVSQSALSHTLNKLRRIFADELFLRTGRGVVPSSKADRLVYEMRSILNALTRLANVEGFDPSQYRGHFTLGISGYETHWIMPRVFRRIRHEAPNASLTLRPKGDMLERSGTDDGLDVVLTRLGEADKGIYTEHFWDDEYVTYYDSSARSAPRKLETFLAASHAIVVFGRLNQRTVLDRTLRKRGLSRKVVLQLPDFDAVPPLLKGTDILVTLPLLLSKRLMRGFAYIDCPIKLPSMPYGMVWHVRNQHDPAQKWFRQVLHEEAAKLGGS